MGQGQSLLALTVVKNAQHECRLQGCNVSLPFDEIKEHEEKCAWRLGNWKTDIFQLDQGFVFFVRLSRKGDIFMIDVVMKGNKEVHGGGVNTGRCVEGVNVQGNLSAQAPDQPE